jgi:hypothetical protein
MDEPTAQRGIFEVLWQMRKDGYSENTIKPIGRRLRNLAKHANLDNPEKVKDFIAKAEWSNGYKENMVNAYNHYAVFHSLEWRKPRYQRAFSIKKLPLESDIDLIISYTRTRNRVAFKTSERVRTKTYRSFKIDFETDRLAQRFSLSGDSKRWRSKSSAN